MSFVKRNVVLSAARPATATSATAAQTKSEKQLQPGLRPSPVDGRLTTSTGTSSLDQLLAGHGGLPLGTSLLIEEQGTTDFSGTILRYYAAEGLVQGHQVHVLGYPADWKHQLPGLAAPDKKGKAAQPMAPPEDKMKIAWRYESLGNNQNAAAARGEASPGATFCHSFDLGRRLAVSSCPGVVHPMPSTGPPTLDRISNSQTPSPFKAIIKHLRTQLETSAPTTIHRLVIPSLLSPSLYAAGCGQPSEVLQFLHGLRALLREHSTRLTALITLPTFLFPRSSGLVRWMELLCDGVVELIPLPATPAVAAPTDTKTVDQPQGLLKVHALPVYHEKGGGGAATSSFRENLSFSLSASKGLVIKPYSLPPMVEEEKPKKENSPASTVKDGIDF
ncbi:Elongator complex protein 4 [Cercophora scortea]|uniref:Elongator complex protein 4 n=1 Tax=Cercophora scortea TaxID=314031 RepID=A0AAE0IEN9_9PEZI|nr:Elongator complex protein 4 [Cercophora scortea]